MGALDGLKVLELAWVVAGPRVGRALADYGATVVRVDGAARTDPARVVGPYPDGVVDFTRSALWDNCNAGKLGLSLDMTRSEAQQAVRDLVPWADVVTESYSPGQVARWGLGYEVLSKLNPRLIMLSSCLMGQEGPLARTAGFGNVGAAACGFQVLVGRRGAEPIGPAGPYTDFVAPRFTLVTLLAALDHRRRTGEGMYIDASQAEAGLQFIAPQLADYAATGRIAAADGNRDPQMTPHGVFACADHEGWLALAVRDDADWARLAAILGLDDPRFATLAGRRAHEDELEASVEAWTRTLDAHAAQAALQAAGVPAHVAATSKDFCADPQIVHRRHILSQPHPCGASVIEASRFALSDTPAELGLCAPPCGRDNARVLQDFAGYDEAKIAALTEAGVLR
ncbi:MAG TPA: CoA transferase [Caulobacteraceae bacterium]|jgi:crotonobetainyl-CoA:carnitine CoA-transferase CaiB-like acyl-CoA transferase|nr:CoA transferase [Caulobacteraceae bacterium]